MDVLSPVLSILKAGYDFYGEVKSAGEQVQRSIRSHEQITRSLKLLQDGLKRKPKTGINKPHLDEIENLAKSMAEVATEVNVILESWNRPDWEWANFRSKRMEKLTARLSFTFAGKADALDKCIASLSWHQDRIDQQLLSMVYHNTDPQAQLSQVKQNLSILFLDGNNRGRSLVSEAYAQLIRAQTKKAKMPWSIGKIHSAGLYVKHKSEIVDTQEDLNFTMEEGNEKAYVTALACVFDNTVVFPDKEKIHKNFQSRKSRGLALEAFGTYDYIFVFTPRLKTDAEKLIMAVRKRFGTKIVPVGKANVVLLGSFDNTRDDLIANPKNEADPAKRRANWNKAYAKIRLSFQGWLTKTQGWSKPPKSTQVK